MSSSSAVIPLGYGWIYVGQEVPCDPGWPGLLGFHLFSSRVGDFCERVNDSLPRVV